MPRANKGQQKVPILKKTTDLCPCRSYYSNVYTFPGGAELVSCTGNHGHYYPFGDGVHVEGTKILWQFMKAHALNQWVHAEGTKILWQFMSHASY